MLSMRYHGPCDVRLDDIPIPEIGPNELLIQTEAAAICGSDIRMWQSNLIQTNAPLPLVLGHEFAGTIVKRGRNITQYREGTRVAVAPNFGCGICDQCVSGNSHLCSSYQAFGINLDGAFAQFVRVPEMPIRSGNIIELPCGVSVEEAAINEPLSCVYNGFLKCRPKAGETALVIGAGPIGILHATLLLMAGLSVTINDISESRLELCQRILPEARIFQGSDHLTDYVRDTTRGHGLDVAIVACPVPSAQAGVLTLMNYGGRVNFFGGVPKSAQPVAIDTNLIHYKELYLTGSTRASVSQFRKTLEFIASGQLSVKNIITSRVPIQEGLTAMECARKGIGLKNVLTFVSEESPVPISHRHFDDIAATVPIEVTQS